MNYRIFPGRFIGGEVLVAFAGRPCTMPFSLTDHRTNVHPEKVACLRFARHEACLRPWGRMPSREPGLDLPVRATGDEVSGVHAARKRQPAAAADVAERGHSIPPVRFVPRGRVRLTSLFSVWAKFWRVAVVPAVASRRPR
jgi:hypothetical protein